MTTVNPSSSASSHQAMEPQTLSATNPLKGESTASQRSLDPRQPFSKAQLINLVVGIVGIQFAWSMQIALSSQVLEPLGANPFLLGFIWTAGPVTGILVQPIVGSLSDKSWTRWGRRRPYILVGALLCALAMLVFPFAPSLLAAAALIWVIDACVNISQGPYRAMVPDNVPTQQAPVANAYMNAAFGIGSVVSLGLAPLLAAFGMELSIAQQYVLAAISIVLLIGYTCLTIKERTQPAPSEQSASNRSASKDEGFFSAFKTFMKVSPEVYKICGVQFFTWIAIMCIFIYLTQFIVHNIYALPDLSGPGGEALLTANPSLAALKTEATRVAQLSLVAFNFTSLLLAIPLGYLSTRFGKKMVHSVALGCMALACASAPFLTAGWQVIAMMAVAGVAWATVLSIPFSILGDYIPPGKEGSLMGIFNMFVAMPQFISALGVGYLITQMPVQTAFGPTHYWTLAFIVAAAASVVAIAVLQTMKESRPPHQGENNSKVAA